MFSSRGSLAWRRPRVFPHEQSHRIAGAGLLLAAVLMSGHSVEAQWQIANPSPGLTFTRLVVGGDGQVAGAVVEGYGLMASPSGTNAWRSQNLPQSSTVDDRVQDLHWAHGRWVAASPNYLHSSADLVNWTSSPQSGANPQVLVWNGAKYWAFGPGGKAFSSADAAAWSAEAAHNLPLGQLLDAAWFQDRYVVCGIGGIASSADGAAWTRHVSAPAYVVGDMDAGGGVLMATGNAQGAMTTNLFRSTDGVQWTPVAVPPSPGGYPSIVHGDGRWLLLSYSGNIYSSDDAGLTWQFTGGVRGETRFYRALGYRASDRRFFLGGVNGGIFSSTDGGARWTNHQEGSKGDVTMVAYGGGRLVATGADGAIFTSADGTRWSSNYSGADDRPVSLRYLNGAFLSYSLSPPSTVRSTDGVNFTRTTGGPPIRDVLWDGTRYVGYDNAQNLYSSSDGVDWVAIPDARHPSGRTTTVGIGSFAHLDGRYLIFSQGFAGETRFFSSSDLVTWTTNILSGIPNNDYSDFVRLNGKYYLSAQSAMFTSSDGVNWTGINYTLQVSSLPQPAGATLFERGGRLYTLQYLPGVPSFGQRLIVSDDGANWSLVTNSFPAPFFPQSKNRLIDTGTRLIAAYFAGGLFAYDDIVLSGGGSTGGKTPFEEWAVTQGLPAGKTGPLDDPDGDGVVNGAEFAFGTEAGTAGSFPARTATPYVEGGQSYPSVTLTRRKALGTLRVTVDAASSVGFAGLLPVVELPAVDLGGGLERVTFRTAESARPSGEWFFRIRVDTP
ncbi:MAG: hypothetical protein IT580_07390 [Verrucomicrobiales bacterium]|nr:hypothetical protein [Verrucomicrobiales bacterium]